MVTIRVVSDVLFSSLDLFCPAPHERPMAAASFRDLGWLAAISFCVARGDSLSLVSLHSASRANRLPPFELLELYVGPVTLVHSPCPSNKTMQPTAGRFDASLHSMKTRPLQATLALALASGDWSCSR